MDYRDKVLSLAQVSPLVPTQVAKALNTNSLLAGAMLSEMSSKGILKVSNLKVGTSPLYYVPGNEGQLLNFLSSLNPKDREAVLLLKEKKVLRDSSLYPLVRACLKVAKDFAVPLEVTFNKQKEIFWKWFLLPDKEAESFIREIITPLEPPKPVALEKPKLEKSKTEKIKKIEKPDKQKTLIKTETKLKAVAKPKKISTPKLRKNFWSKIDDFLKENYVDVVEKTNLKRTDFEIVVAFNSPFGQLKYFCKAVQKSKITEADISSAFAKAKLKNLPLIFLSNGAPDANAEKFFELGVLFKRL